MTKNSGTFNGYLAQHNLPTGSKTFLQSFTTIFTKGSLISVPKKCKSKLGVTKIPAILLNTALQIDVATFPSHAEVSMMHMFTVVGRQVMIRIPSTSEAGIRFGRKVVRKLFRGAPIRNGQAPNIAS